jgi:muramoyltetrapeptide carboxypeptidase LdcA involved in peptidoglycan recycling
MGLSGDDLDIFMRFIRQWSESIDMPVAYGFPMGHGSRNISVPFNVKAKLSGMSLIIQEPLFL